MTLDFALSSRVAQHLVCRRVEDGARGAGVQAGDVAPSPRDRCVSVVRMVAGNVKPGGVAAEREKGVETPVGVERPVRMGNKRAVGFRSIAFGTEPIRDTVLITFSDCNRLLNFLCWI